MTPAVHISVALRSLLSLWLEAAEKRGDHETAARLRDLLDRVGDEPSW
jgi:hypothetical protein